MSMQHEGTIMGLTWQKRGIALLLARFPHTPLVESLRWWISAHVGTSGIPPSPRWLASLRFLGEDA